MFILGLNAIFSFAMWTFSFWQSIILFQLNPELAALAWAPFILNIWPIVTSLALYKLAGEFYKLKAWHTTRNP